MVRVQENKCKLPGFVKRAVFVRRFPFSSAVVTSKNTNKSTLISEKRDAKERFGDVPLKHTGYRYWSNAALAHKQAETKNSATTARD